MSLQFLPLEGRARWATVLLGGTIIVDLVAIASDFREISAINDFLDGDFDTTALSDSDDLQSFVALITFIALAATGIAFIRWFYAAYRNVTLLAPSEVRYKPGWAIGAWFVPFLNIWRPKQIADDIWRVSEQQPPPAYDQPSRLGATEALMKWWWAFWIIGTFVGNFGARALLGTRTLADIRDSDKVDIASTLLDIAAAVLAIVVIQRITGRLEGTSAPAEEAGTPPEPEFALP
jgi:hypothetical protein